MSRSGYTHDGDIPAELWQQAVDSALFGKRGQTFLRDLLAALDAMPIKELIAHELVTETGEVCALGALGKARCMPDLDNIDPECPEDVADAFGIARAMAAEIAYQNDKASYLEGFGYVRNETPAARWTRMRKWVSEQIIRPKAKAEGGAS